MPLALYILLPYAALVAWLAVEIRRAPVIEDDMDMATEVLLLESDRNPPRVWIGMNGYRAFLLEVEDARKLYRQLGRVLPKPKRKTRK